MEIYIIVRYVDDASGMMFNIADIKPTSYKKRKKIADAILEAWLKKTWEDRPVEEREAEAKGYAEDTADMEPEEIDPVWNIDGFSVTKIKWWADEDLLIVIAEPYRGELVTFFATVYND